MAEYHDEPHLLSDVSSQQIGKNSLDSRSSASTTSLVLERIGERVAEKGHENSKANGDAFKYPQRNNLQRYADNANDPAFADEDENTDEDLENGPFIGNGAPKKDDRKTRRLLIIVASIVAGSWVLALFVFLGRQAYRGDRTHDPSATSTPGSGKKITMEELRDGTWSTDSKSLSWIAGADGGDGLLLEQGVAKKDYLVVDDVRGKNRTGNEAAALRTTQTLMKKGAFSVGGRVLYPSEVWPSKDLKKVLIATNKVSNWRHSFYAQYWIFDVATQTAEALDNTMPEARVQLATWSPRSDAIVFTRDNNMFLRKLSSPTVIQITKDGGPNNFYGVPDWVYEEEVFQTNCVTWWSEDGKFVAFLKTDESAVPTFPVQYFLSRPSGKDPPPGEDAYPEVREIKYPKAGAPNPTVSLQFYDVEKADVFEVPRSAGLDADRLITEIVWAGSTGKVLVRETNRESDKLHIILVDTATRTGKTVRTEDVQKLDGGWFEVSQQTRYIPADPSKNRKDDGYIDTIIHEGYDHLGYFTPLDNPKPIVLTSGEWEVVSSPSAIDLDNNLVYFVSTKESALQRHVYYVKLDGTGLTSLSDTSKEGYYDVEFSTGAGYALVTYKGPNIPWQRVISTPGNAHKYSNILTENRELAKVAAKHELPIKIFSTVNIDGFELNVVERRPPHFDEKKKYPVLFFLYAGPMSQTVDKRFTVDFQAYIASNLGYIVVTVDGRGTGFMGRKTRSAIRDNIGYYEARDQIETAKIWAAKKYVDSSRLAIWGWSYGGFMTLKTLEQDAGRTFKYGMAVAPVTDWRFYDSIYTERYMHTPQHNPGGYDNSTVRDVKALAQNVRFLVMHGISDDNVHVQNTLHLLDRLDLAGVENYDVHVFPDSDHSIYFHNANKIVYDKLSNWLINAFNGEWLRTENAVPMQIASAPKKIRSEDADY